MLEVCKGAYASPPRPLLLVDDEAMATEVRQLAACIVPDGETQGGPMTAAAARAGGGGVGGRRSAGSRGGAGRRGCRLSPDEADALLLDLGLVLQHIQEEQETTALASGDLGRQALAAAAQVSGLDRPSLLLKARRLLAFACDMGWVVVAARLMPLATSGCRSHAHAIQVINRASAASAPTVPRSPPLCGGLLPLPLPGKGKGTGGLSLLHRAVRSGSTPLVAWLLQWSTAAEAGGGGGAGSWHADQRGPLGVTPLHLAALLEDGGVVAAMLLRHCPGGAFTRWVVGHKVWSQCGPLFVFEFKLSHSFSHFHRSQVGLR